MTLKFALAGLAAFAGVGLAGSASAAMPNGLPQGASPAANIENVRLVCDVYGRCWHRPNFYGPRPYYGGGYGYYGPPRVYGPRFYGPRPYYGGGWRRGW